MKTILESINKIVNQYSPDEIEIANKTSRNTGAIGKNAIVPNYVLNNVEKNKKILDFGAGKAAAHSQMLRDNDFEDVTAYEFGSNHNDELHDKNALKKKYDVVFASNVLNVQSSVKMLENTLEIIRKVTKAKGVFIGNLPMSPRKFDELNADLLEEKLKEYFSSVERVGGTKSAPIYKCQ